jgi:16S rRNA (guanine966-N2)-methyltransferase
LRGKKLFYSGEDRTRPMKDRVREAVFNLIGPAVAGKHALDLFAGTGALGFEAISRGAAAATFVERHFPTADHIRQTAAALGVADRTRIEAANALIWIQRDSPPKDLPWVAFVSPPWALFSEQPEAMLALIVRLVELCPPESMVVVEADESFDFQRLPQAERWDVRNYRPAIVGLLRIGRA